ncbi:MAG: haloacid dehalogenase [Anaerolineales bacterium]|jgi:translin|nr:haloacid dehalogenase [Anaerolineales bacterium]
MINDGGKVNIFEGVAETIRQTFEVRTAARDLALAQTRLLTRHCANAIRAVHRDEKELATEHLQQAGEIAVVLKNDLADYPDFLYAGYTQDALKEYAEANLVFALIQNNELPLPEQIGVPSSTYLQGLAEAVGELRRRCLDQLRLGKSEEATRLLNLMDDIYTVLITMDYPDAVTGGLRRLTDVARSLLERTRGDLTISLRQEQLETKLRRLEGLLAERL